MKKILLITPFLRTSDIQIEATPVANYFAHAWVKQGYDVRVIHLPSLFPWWMRMAAKPFLKTLETKLSATINCEKINERQYVEDGVKYYRIPMIKTKPHARYKKKIINNTFNKIIDYLTREDFSPDVVIAHWVNPGAEILDLLKSRYDVPTCIVLHTNGQEFQSIYEDKASYYRERIDVWGFRSMALKEEYEKIYGAPQKWFICYSGIPDKYVEQGVYIKPYKDRMVFVGNLRKNKNPDAIIKAIAKIFLSTDRFEMKYIGEGALESEIRSIARENHYSEDQIKLLGYMPREKVLDNLKESDVLIMISSKEVFGLVYLEAMAMGCIPIGSKGQGIDGVIVDGENGFLVPAGDEEALAQVLAHIRQMTDAERETMVKAAFCTAKSMTDSAVAASYIDNVFKYSKL